MYLFLYSARFTFRTPLVFYAIFFCYIPGFFSAAEKFSQNPQGMGNYFKESNDGLWNWISLRYSDQSSPYFSGIVLRRSWLNHTNSGFSFKDLLHSGSCLWLLKLMTSLAVLNVRGSARGCSGGSRGGARGFRAPLSEGLDPPLARYGWFTNRFTQKCWNLSFCHLFHVVRHFMGRFSCFMLHVGFL